MLSQDLRDGVASLQQYGVGHATFRGRWPIRTVPPAGRPALPQPFPSKSDVPSCVT